MVRLSKSKVMSGLQCAKRLYLEARQPELSEFSESAEAAFEIGNEVGETARSLYPGGVLIDTGTDLNRALKETEAALAAPGDLTIFEATFRHESVLIKADLLHRKKKRHEIVEVKSSTMLKDHHLQDAAIQAWVIAGSGLRVTSTSVSFIDNSFVYPGGRRYDGLFNTVDVSREIRPLPAQVPLWVEQCQRVLAGGMPDIGVGAHCHAPYDCPFLAHCTPEGPEFPVTILPRGGNTTQALIADGYADLLQVPLNRLQNQNHIRVWRASRSGEAEIGSAAKVLLESLPWPRYFIDFETVQFPVPVWQGTRPYEQLPFQWSCHSETGRGKLEHQNFLDTAGNPAPMRAFAESLIGALGTTGPVFTYSAFESTTLNNLAKRFPDLALPLAAIVDRIVDLLPIVREHYYHPSMKGSWSIKVVLPAIAPELAYDRLGAVQDGAAAGHAYREIVTLKEGDPRRQSLIDDLERYCAHDTFGIVEIVRFLEGRRGRVDA